MSGNSDVFSLTLIHLKKAAYTLKKRVKCKHQKTSSMSGFEQCGQNIAQLRKVGAFEKWPGAFFFLGALKLAQFSPFGRILKIFGSYHR